MSRKLNLACRTIQPTITRRLLCTKKTGQVSNDALAALDEGYKKLLESDSKSLLKKHLSQSIFDKLKPLTTPTFESTLLDCIQSGLTHHDSSIGIYAPDPEAYTVFADLFDPVIEDYHGFKKSDKQPPMDFGNIEDFCDMDPDKCFVLSTRIRCARSVECFPFQPRLTEAQYIELEWRICQALDKLQGEHAGRFIHVKGMGEETKQKFIDQHLMFKEGDRFLEAANATCFWPTGRGIFFNAERTFVVWVNEEDHLRIISMDKGGELGKVYKRLVEGVLKLSERLKFMRHERLGFLAMCPSNLGTTIRASVHVRLPLLAADQKQLEELAAKHQLQVRGTRGEHSNAEDGVYDISNKKRLGITEYEAVATLRDGVVELIALEKKLMEEKK